MVFLESFLSGIRAVPELFLLELSNMLKWLCIFNAPILGNIEIKATGFGAQLMSGCCLGVGEVRQASAIWRKTH